MKPENFMYPIPQLSPRPFFCDGVETPTISIHDNWYIKYSFDTGTLLDDPDFESWEKIVIPSSTEATRQDKTSDEREPYVYKKRLDILPEWKDKRLIIYFESVNAFASVYINNELLAEHKNPFLAFEADITDAVKDKESVVISVKADEQKDKVCSFSSGGILRGVHLFVRPQTGLSTMRAHTRFDNNFRNASVCLEYLIDNPCENTSAELILTDPFGLLIARKTLNTLATYDELQVEKPLQWDAEHPWLYNLEIAISQYGKLLETCRLQYGFRQINRAGNRLLVNGKEVKLRGVCRHEVSALNGRCLTNELIRQDVLLFKEANCNYIRTSHYPPSEYFLRLCDEHGIYVENELPLAFIARSLDYTQRDPEYTKRYLSVFADIFARDFNHPSVIIWSLCNESFGGHNFDLLNRFAQKQDPTRPTKFSYPMTMREEHAPVDIWSIHYTELDVDLSAKLDNVSVPGAPGYDMPVLHDECTHIPCYNRTEHRRDPNVRNFWGESIRLFWDKVMETDGALGGAIWAGIDETNVYNGGNTSLEWGIIDIWRRKKPEFYLVRKAYSPVKITFQKCKKTDDIFLATIENRFFHTCLSEISISCSYGNSHKKIRPIATPPGRKWTFEIPFAAVHGEELKMDVYDAVGAHVDEYAFVPLEAQKEAKTSQYSPINIFEEELSYIINGDNFSIEISKQSGLIASAKHEQKEVLIGGPILHVPYYRLGIWKKEDVKVKKEKDRVLVTTSGSYENSADVLFEISIDLGGKISVTCTINKLHRDLPHKEKLRVGVDCGGLDELGICFTSSPSMDTLSWKRNAEWSCYPDDHIGRPIGTANRYCSDVKFGQKPDILWSDDSKSFLLNGKYDVGYKGTNDFRSLKAKIYSATLSSSDSGSALAIVSNGSHSVRAEIAEPIENIIYCTNSTVKYGGEWYEQLDYRGSRNGTEKWSNSAGSCAEIEFEGTGIVWYGPEDTICGIAKVWVDGELIDDNINQLVQGCDFPGSADGYDKKYDYPVFSATDLEYKKHTLKIEVTGKKTSDAHDSYIILDYFRVIKTHQEEPVNVLVLTDYNYPHIAWGNYTKPAINIDNFSRIEATIKLGAEN